MKLRVEQVHPANPHPVATVAIEGSQTPNLQPGQILRCGGYRYTILKVVGTQGGGQHQLGLMLETENGVRPGMVLRPVNAPIEDDELASMCARMSHVLQCIAELDASNVLDRMLPKQGEDKALEWMKAQGVRETATQMFALMTELKAKLPPLERQRKFGEAAATLNAQLSVIQMADGDRAQIGG